MSAGKCLRASAASTAFSAERGRSSGHCETADGVMPSSLAALVTVPPRSRSASVLLIVMRPKISTLIANEKPANVFSRLNSWMTSLQDRIEDLMATMSWTHSDLVRISGASSSVVSQWRGKGTKTIKSIGAMEAATRLAAASGFSALWLAKGVGPRLMSEGEVLRPPIVSEPPKAYLTPADVLSHLGSLLQAVPEDMRGAAADLLAGMARTGGDPGRQAVLVQLLTAPSSKREAAA